MARRHSHFQAIVLLRGTLAQPFQTIVVLLRATPAQPFSDYC